MPQPGARVQSKEMIGSISVDGQCGTDTPVRRFLLCG
jgi:hypothetical protein